MSLATLPRFGVLTVVLLAGAACRTPGVTSASFSDLGSSKATGRTSDIIGGEEIGKAHVHDAHEAVMRLRPEFLRQRSRPSQDDPSGGLPMVYLDGVRQGGPEMLRTIPARAVAEIRYLSPTAASDRFGPYYAAGVIAVRTKH